MKQRLTELIVGAFVLAGVGLIAWGIFTIRGQSLGSLERYPVRYKNVSALAVDAAVKYNGLLVGRVESMVIDPEDASYIRVTVAIASSTPILDDTIAQITRADLLGDEYIDFRPLGRRKGSADALQVRGQPLAPGEFIAGGEPFDLQGALQSLAATIQRTDAILSDLQAQVTQAATTINRILDRGDELLSDENVARLQGSLDDLVAAVGVVRQIASDNKSNIDQIMVEAGEATTSLRDTTVNLRTSMDRLLPQFELLTSDVRGAVGQLRGMATTADHALDSLDVQQINDLVENLDVASRNLAEFTREIKERPYRLIRKEKPEESAP